MTIFEFTLWGIHIAPTYYGLAYAIGFLGAYAWVRHRKKFSERELDILLYAIIAGILLGGRFGYVFFYNLPYYLEHPLKALAVWEGGMSFHGGIIGVTIAVLIYAWRMRRNLWQVADEVAATVPLGIFLGRIANYLNGELFGYAGYTGPFAMMHNGLSHFPSPLIESWLEGLVLGAILLSLQSRNPRHGIVAGTFLVGYAVARIVSEVFFRLPDTQIGYLWGGLSLGSWLSVLVLAAGFFVLWFSGLRSSKA